MSTPGTIDIIHGNLNVVNVMGQVTQGSTSRKRMDFNDTVGRKRHFKKGLDALVAFLTSEQCQRDDQGKVVVVFPKNIGCGLAGGDWTEYRAMIIDFANQVDENTIVRIVVFSPF